MKKIIFIFLLVAQSLVAQDNSFLIEGNIYDISKSDTIGYSLYENVEGHWSLLFRKSLNPLATNLSFNSYREQGLNLNTTYLLVFHKNQQYKHLYVEVADSPGKYKMNVFFKEATQALIYYNYELYKYVSLLIEADTVESLLKEGK